MTSPGDLIWHCVPHMMPPLSFLLSQSKIHRECSSKKKKEEEHLVLMDSKLLVVDVLSLFYEKMIEVWVKAARNVQMRASVGKKKKDCRGLIFAVHCIDWLGIIAHLSNIICLFALGSKLLGM